MASGKVVSMGVGVRGKGVFEIWIQTKKGGFEWVGRCRRRQMEITKRGSCVDSGRWGERRRLLWVRGFKWIRISQVTFLGGAFNFLFKFQIFLFPPPLIAYLKWLSSKAIKKPISCSVPLLEFLPSSIFHFFLFSLFQIFTW